MASSTYFHLNFVGDVMIGRLIDQLLPVHVNNVEESAYIARAVVSNPRLKDYNSKSPWGNTLPLFLSSHLNLINLETSATIHPKLPPDKVFNYRTHPTNVQCLKEARIDYVSLANNHTLDFCKEGLLETVRTLKHNNIKFAGSGETKDEARRPAVLSVKDEEREYRVEVWSASDHPDDWSVVPNFHLIDYTSDTCNRLRTTLTTAPDSVKPDLKICSVHWGPNYSWTPSQEIRDLAHYLIDECDVDIIHGHSSHHIQGVEFYESKLIIYGCGDFVDDYAIKPDYRNDLSGIWRVGVGPEQHDGAKRLRVESLEVFPTRIQQFQADLLLRDDTDHHWVVEKFKELSRSLGTRVQDELGGEGQIVVHIA